MSRNNTIGIVGEITAPPELIVDAADWARKVYEAELTRTRPSGTEDTYILQYDGRAAGSKEMLERITEGAEIFCGGEIRSENVHDPKPEENRVKVFIFAEMIAVNDPPVEDQNEVTICGNICKPPSGRETKRRTRKGRRVTVTRLVVAVNTPTGAYYVPCVCWNEQAEKAADLKVGDYVEIYGRFQSRNFKKCIQGRKLPYLSTSYEVSVVKLEAENKEERTGEK